MNAAPQNYASATGGRRRKAWLAYVSGMAAVLFVVGFFVSPACYCPNMVAQKHLALAAIGLVPLICGPHLYRFLGAAMILFALLSMRGDVQAAADGQRKQEAAQQALEMEVRQPRRQPSPAPNP